MEQLKKLGTLLKNPLFYFKIIIFLFVRYIYLFIYFKYVRGIIDVFFF